MGDKEKPIIFCKPDIGTQEIKAVTDVLKSGWLSTGPVVMEFQKQLEEFIGSGYATVVNSCTEALMLSLIVSNIGEGDEVLVPTNTFCATANAVIQVGAKPVFVDVKPTGHIDHDLIQHKVTNRTKAIIPVHYTGMACNMDAINYEARNFNLKVIEDAAHAFGGEYNGQKIGTISDFTCFSFYATKNITSAEGGFVMCKSPDMAAKIGVLAMQGQTQGAWRRYGVNSLGTQVEYVGHKGNMSDVHAAIGLAQLQRWPEIRKRRNIIWDKYEKKFGKCGEGHARHLFTIRIDKRDGLKRYLSERNIGTGIHFKPLHLEPAYKHLGYKEGDFPRSEFIGKHTLSLPVSSSMDVEDADRVIESVKEFQKGNNE